jgi:hypothetical protein
MGESLKDQLIKAGLATEEQARKAERKPRTRKKAPRPKTKPQAKGRAAPKPTDSDLAAAYRARERQEQRERQQAEQAEREAAERRRRTRAEIRTLLDRERLNDPEAETPYHFAVGSKIKQVYVTDEQQVRLADGELAIVLLDGQRHLVPIEVGRRINELDPSRVVVFHDDEAEPEPGPS